MKDDGQKWAVKWGCAASGVSGNVSIQLDEAISGPEKWALSIQFPEFYICVLIDGVEKVSGLLDYLRRHAQSKEFSEFVLGKIDQSQVVFVKDDEFHDRFFLNTSANDGSIQYTICHNLLSDLIEAMDQVFDEL